MGSLIEHRAVVRSVADGRMTVHVDASGCDSCGHGSQCAMNRLVRAQDQSALMELPVLQNVQVGDELSLSLPESGMGLYALIGYLVPALSFLLGAALGSSLTQTDAGTAIGALLGFLLSLLVTRFALPFLKPLQPTATRWVGTP